MNCCHIRMKPWMVIVSVPVFASTQSLESMLKSVEHHTLHEMKDRALNKHHQEPGNPKTGLLKTHQRRLGKLKSTHAGVAMYNVLKHHTLNHEIKDQMLHHQKAQQSRTGSMERHQRRLAKLKTAHFGTTYIYLKTLFGKITSLNR